MIWAWKRKEWLNFHFVSILSLGWKRMYLVKPPKDARVECDKHMTNYVGKGLPQRCLPRLSTEFIPFMSWTSTKMLCVLEIGYKLVQNAFRKPRGTFARVNIGHVFLFVRFKWILRTRTPRAFRSVYNRKKQKQKNK